MPLYYDCTTALLLPYVLRLYYKCTGLLDDGDSEDDDDDDDDDYYYYYCSYCYCRQDAPTPTPHPSKEIPQPRGVHGACYSRCPEMVRGVGG